eukprot:1342671-Pyramimonas_sp.AAC.1
MAIASKMRRPIGVGVAAKTSPRLLAIFRFFATSPSSPFILCTHPVSIGLLKALSSRHQEYTLKWSKLHISLDIPCSTNSLGRPSMNSTPSHHCFNNSSLVRQRSVECCSGSSHKYWSSPMLRIGRMIAIILDPGDSGCSSSALRFVAGCRSSGDDPSSCIRSPEASSRCLASCVVFLLLSAAA